MSGCQAPQDRLITASPAATPLASAPSPQPAPFTIDGTIEQMAQEGWVVAGTPVVLDSHTAISGTPTLGATAHVHGVRTAADALLAQSIIVDVLTQTPTSTPAPTLTPTATPLPSGTVVNITGVIETISITNNVTVIVVNNITYMLPHNVVVILGKRLRIGVPIVFVGQVDTVGQIIIINVIQINHQVIVINPPRQHDDEGEDEDD